MGKLTPKQLKFCYEYLIDLNGTQAAIRAGYARHTANRTAHKLMLKADIKAKIEALKQEQIKRAEISQDNVIKELAAIGFADLKTSKIKASDKIKALELLGRYFNIFDNTADAPINNTNTAKVEIYIPDNRRENL